MSLLTVTGTTRLALNVKFLAIRLIGISIRMLPFRAILLNGLGAVIGLFFMFLRIGQWRAIKRFARHIGSPLPALLYIVKYFAQQGKDGVWGYVFCETPSVLDQYVTTWNAEALRNALARGKGAIVLGAHYGPALNAYMLSKMHFNVKILFVKEYVMELRNAGTLVLAPFRSKKVMFLNDSGVVLVAQKQEKHLVSHVKKGGVIALTLDFPGPTRKDATGSLFGLSICPQVFPFRLALKYDIPVFFYLFNNMKHGGYRLDFMPSGEYSTPEEGFQRYLSRLEAQIKGYPFMWNKIPQFFEWS